MAKHMNVTDIAPKPKNARLGRIQRTSGLLKFGLVAWIMDEGRKIQEEQALTV